MPRTPTPHTSVSLSRLAVVTCHFDPHESRSRIDNYHRFAGGLADHGIELFAIVARFAGQPTPPIDGPNVQHVTVRDSLWHKERLLNLQIHALPSDIDAVGWFDADTLFRMIDPQLDYQQAVIDSLNDWPVIQPWKVCEWLAEDGSYIPWHNRGGDTDRWCGNMAFRNHDRATPITRPSWAHPGLAWAIRRDTFEAVGGLFDMHPIGGGDAMMAIGLWGDWQSPYLGQYNQAMRDAAIDWGRRVYDEVQGRVGFVRALASHLWHGSRENRRYGTRNRDLSRLGIDPRIHLATADNGTLCWSEACPEKIKQFVADYFAGRCEDGESGGDILSPIESAGKT